MKEGPCCCYKDHGQYASWRKQGDIAGAFFGHDHTNNMVGKTDDGITLGYNAGCGFNLDGDGLNRSMRMFVIDENDALELQQPISPEYGDIMPDDGGPPAGRPDRSAHDRQRAALWLSAREKNIGRAHLSAAPSFNAEFGSRINAIKQMGRSKNPGPFFISIYCIIQGFGATYAFHGALGLSVKFS